MPAKQNLFDHIVAVNNTKKGPSCTMQMVMAALSPDDLDGLNRALANPDIRGTAIRKALADRGLKVSDTTLGRHRRGECLCGS